MRSRAELDRSILGLSDVLAAADASFFFVVGAPRSGTTWLERALNAHPEISCAGEAHVFEELAPLLAEALTRYKKRVRTRSQLSLGDASAFLTLDRMDKLLSLAIVLLLKKNARSGSRWIGEKTPDNLWHMGHLRRLFPQARFIHVYRDPRDVCVSAWLNNLRLGEEQTKRKWSDFRAYVPVHAGSWAKRIVAARSFGQQHPEAYHEVGYEALVDPFDRSFVGILRFLGAPFLAEIVAGCRTAASFERSAGRPVGTEDVRSHFRKGQPGAWRSHFDAALCREYGEIAGEQMRALNYDPAF